MLYLQSLSSLFLPTYSSSILSTNVLLTTVYKCSFNPMLLSFELPLHHGGNPEYYKPSFKAFWIIFALWSDCLHVGVMCSRCQIFHYPVDPTMEGCSDYYKVILEAMDLEKMEKRLHRGGYQSIETFQNDFETMIENCCFFNYVQPSWYSDD